MSTVLDKIIAHENGELGVRETIELFSEITLSGVVWELQGSYGRAAQGLIEAGILSPIGAVTKKGRAFIEEAEQEEGFLEAP